MKATITAVFGGACVVAIAIIIWTISLSYTIFTGEPVFMECNVNISC